MAFEPSEIGAIAAAYTAAWNTGRPEAVAAFFTLDGCIVINGGTPWTGRAGVRDMAAGFFADVPDLSLVCDGVRSAGRHALYLWTFTGAHAASQNRLKVVGWEEWDLEASGLVSLSRGWFDADSYARQTKSEKQ